jgi:hypothetical protein
MNLIAHLHFMHSQTEHDRSKIDQCREFCRVEAVVSSHAVLLKPRRIDGETYGRVARWSSGGHRLEL